MTLQVFLQHAFTGLDVLFLVFKFLLDEVGLDLVAGMIGLDDLEPVFRWCGILVCTQFHNITGLQRRIQRYQHAID